VSRPRIACECVPRGAGYHGFGYAARVKGTHPQPRSARRTAFRTGFRTGLRAGRRVIMWAALVAAIGIGVVWAGGRRTSFFCAEVWGRSQYPVVQILYIEGCLGGIVVERRMIVDSIFAEDVRFRENTRHWMWLPSLSVSSEHNWELRVPYWIPTLLCLTTFALLFRVERRERRLARAGHCVCGYSLAGLGEGAVCPECGVERASVPSGRRPGRS